MSMPKSKDPVRAISICLPESLMAFVGAHGTESGFSKKIQNILVKYRDTYANMVVYDNKESEEATYVSEGAICVFEITSDGQRIWQDCPWEKFVTKNYKNIPAEAEQHGFLSQVYENKSIGYYAVWVKKNRKSCEECKTQLMRAIKEV